MTNSRQKRIRKQGQLHQEPVLQVRAQNSPVIPAQGAAGNSYSILYARETRRACKLGCARQGEILFASATQAASGSPLQGVAAQACVMGNRLNRGQNPTQAAAIAPADAHNPPIRTVAAKET